MDIENRIESWIARAMKFGHESDLAMKKTCLIAAKVVGTYSGTTQEIAKRMRRSVSSVENWSHAAKLYQELRQTNRHAVYCLWRDLPASHWWLAWDIQRAGYDALHYLAMAEQNFWSGRDMLAEYKADREAGNAPLQFIRLKTTIGGMLNEMLTIHRDSLTPRQLAAGEAFWDTLTTEDA